MDFIKPSRPVSKVFLHCSASDNPSHDDISVIRRWHVEGNGWDDVGYHYFIRKNGTLQTGRSLEEDPAAQAPFNTGTIAICAHGLKKANFTESQFATLRDLCGAINDTYDRQNTFHGHCEVANKACPVFDYRRLLELDAEGYMHLHESVVEVPDHRYPMLSMGAQGDAVFLLQLLLGVGSRADGLFGPRTRETVREFQRMMGLTVDGIVGPSTWRALINDE